MDMRKLQRQKVQTLISSPKLQKIFKTIIFANQMSKKAIIIFLLLICILIFACEAQRGGRSSGGRSRSSFRSRSSSAPKKKCQYIDGVKKCKKVKDDDGFSYWYLMIIPLGIYQHFFNLQNAEPRKRKIDGLLKEYIDSNKEQQCCLVVDQRQNIISKLSQSELIQYIVLKDNSQTIICDIKVVNISIVNDFTYSIQLKGKDSVGASNLRGILIFKGSGFGLKLSKEYENRKSSGQTGNYVILMYEGEGDLERVEGTWEFQGYKNTEKYSGKWAMKLKQNSH